MQTLTDGCIKGGVFKRASTYCFDIELTSERYTVHIELYQNVLDENEWRCLFWQTETLEVGLYYEKSNGSYDKDNVLHSIRVDWSHYLKGDFSLFRAKSIYDAELAVTSAIQNFLEEERSAISKS